MMAKTPLVLRQYSGAPTFPERPTFGLKALLCPHCGHDGQRLIRATQHWRDQSDAFCARIHVEMDFLCTQCTQGWQLQVFNEDEGEGEILVVINPALTINQEDGMAPTPDA
jgi:hypothetical protein